MCITESLCCTADSKINYTSVLKKSHEEKGNPLHYSCLENPHGQRSLVGYSPRGHKQSDTTEQLSRHIATGQPILTSELVQNVKLKWRGYITKSWNILNARQSLKIFLITVWKWHRIINIFKSWGAASRQ